MNRTNFGAPGHFLLEAISWPFAASDCHATALKPREAIEPTGSMMLVDHNFANLPVLPRVTI